MISAASIRNVTNVETSTAARYVAGGSGVERIRLSTPALAPDHHRDRQPREVVDATP